MLLKNIENLEKIVFFYISIFKRWDLQKNLKRKVCIQLYYKTGLHGGTHIMFVIYILSLKIEQVSSIVNTKQDSSFCQFTSRNKFQIRKWTYRCVQNTAATLLCIFRVTVNKSWKKFHDID